MPQTYAAPYNFFLSGRPLMISNQSCTGGQITAAFGRDNNQTAIYQSGYVWDGGSWERFTVEATGGTQTTGEWLIGGTGEATFSQASGDWTYYVGYTCHWTGSEWRCGCQTSSCATPAWQLQAARN
ncbi:hypothetical protein GVX82_04295 [Patescibacteria group bacterium]|jgi:hypothetical protein|nr:hypothetical protein [Patescibacteria group bacterium]